MLTNIGKLSLWLDGKTVSFEKFYQHTNGHCLLAWNTDYDTPGQHVVQAQLELNGTFIRGSTPDPTVLAGKGVLTSFYSGNVMQFNSFYAEFDDSGATFFARLAETNASYSIKLITATGAHIKTITNSTSSGEIKENWDLKDDNTNAYSADSVTAVFNVNLPDSG